MLTLLASVEALGRKCYRHFALYGEQSSDGTSLSLHVCESPRTRLRINYLPWIWINWHGLWTLSKRWKRLSFQPITFDCLSK